MVLYKCGHSKNRVLTPELVNKESGAFLRMMRLVRCGISWLGIIRLLRVHYTLGGPWFEQRKDCEFGDLWLRSVRRMMMIRRRRIDWAVFIL